MQLGLIKALYTDKLATLYSYSEAENLFYIALQWLEKKSRTAVLLGQETLLVDTYQVILEDLLLGKPIQYLTKEAPFYGLDFYVDERVLIPRPETEQLVHWVIEDNQNFAGAALDIGTGSGCIPITLSHHWKGAKVSGCDISEDALEVAYQNAETLGVNVELFRCDILTEEINKYDIIISNPPYIAPSEKGEMHINVLNNEPHLALFVGGDDPLIFYKKIIEKVRIHRSKCYFETSEFYRKQLDTWLETQNLRYHWQCDFQGKNRLLRVTF